MSARLVSAALLLGSWLCTKPSVAQGLAAPLVGSQASGPATFDPAAVHYNPAALAGVERSELWLGAVLTVGDLSYERERRARYQRADSLDFALPVEPDAIDASKTGFAERESSHPVGVAPTLFGAHPFAGGRLVAGVGVYSPFAALAAFDDDGAQRFALQSASVATVFVTPAVSYRPVPQLSVGAGVSYVFGVASLRRVQDFAELPDFGAVLAAPPINQSNDFGPDAPPGVRELDTLARPIAIRDAIAHSFTFNVGALFEPKPGVRLGASYQHRVPMTFRGSFTLDMDDDFFTQDLENQGLKFPARVKGDANMALGLPAALRLGAAWDVSSRFAVGVNATYTFWSELSEIRVSVTSPQLAQPEVGLSERSTLVLPRRWHDTVGAELLLTARLSRKLRLWLPLGYRSSAVPDATIDVASLDGDRLVGGLGGRLQLNDRYAVLADAQLQTILPRDVVASSYDRGNGQYRLSLYSLGASLAISW